MRKASEAFNPINAHFQEDTGRVSWNSFTVPITAKNQFISVSRYNHKVSQNSEIFEPLARFFIYQYLFIYLIQNRYIAYLRIILEARIAKIPRKCPRTFRVKVLSNITIKSALEHLGDGWPQKFKGKVPLDT